MKRHIQGGHFKWIVSAMRSFYHIIPEKWFVLFWMCDFVALTRCCKLVSFLCFIILTVTLHFLGRAHRRLCTPLTLISPWPSVPADQTDLAVKTRIPSEIPAAELRNVQRTTPNTRNYECYCAATRLLFFINGNATSDHWLWKFDILPALGPFNQRAQASASGAYG